MVRSEKILDSQNATRHLTARVLLLMSAMTSSGCFNAEAMIESRRVIAIRTRLEEVDLGDFRVTLPHAVEKTNSTELHFHVFGQVANRDLDSVEAMLAKKESEIRHRVLIAARLLTIEDLEDPNLGSLRKRIAELVNEELKGEPVKAVGFYRFGYMQF